jgi:choline dehydrogenase-like flavoprotein
MKNLSANAAVDVVVVGTGAGGAPIIARLAAAGLSVVALEAGRWWKDPASDFATDEVDAAKLYWNEERLSGGETPTAFGANNSGTGVGGSTLHWGAFVPRGDPRDFKLQSEFAVGRDWPLGYHDLKHYYQQVEEFLGVSGPTFYPWDPDRTYPLGPVPLNAPAEAMQRGCEHLGIRTSPAPVAALSRDYSRPEYGLRKACVHRGYWRNRNASAVAAYRARQRKRSGGSQFYGPRRNPGLGHLSRRDAPQ